MCMETFLDPSPDVSTLLAFSYDPRLPSQELALYCLSVRRPLPSGRHLPFWPLLSLASDWYEQTWAESSGWSDSPLHFFCPWLLDTNQCSLNQLLKTWPFIGELIKQFTACPNSHQSPSLPNPSKEQRGLICDKRVLINLGSSQAS